MKIPEKVRIDGIEYEIIDVSGLNDNGEMLCGQIAYRDSEIRVNKSCMKHQFQCITLWHEIVHGIIFASGVEIKDKDEEERIVDAIARGVYQVLQDNARKFYDLRD